MQQEHIRIGELAKSVGVERFVIRFWEKEFGISSERSVGGQRFYSCNDIEFFKAVKHLLYEQKFTIEGAKRALKNGPKAAYIASSKTSLESESAEQADLIARLKELRESLLKLRENL